MPFHFYDMIIDIIAGVTATRHIASSSAGVGAILARKYVSYYQPVWSQRSVRHTHLQSTKGFAYQIWID